MFNIFCIKLKTDTITLDNNNVFHGLLICLFLSQFCVLFWSHCNTESCNKNLLALLQKGTLGLSQQEKSCQPGPIRSPFFVFTLAYCFRFGRRTFQKAWQNQKVNCDPQHQTPQSVCVSQGCLWGLPLRFAWPLLSALHCSRGIKKNFPIGFSMEESILTASIVYYRQHISKDI